MAEDSKVQQLRMEALADALMPSMPISQYTCTADYESKYAAKRAEVLAIIARHSVPEGGEPK